MDSLCGRGSSGHGGMKVVFSSGIFTMIGRWSELSVAGETCVTGLWSEYMLRLNAKL